MTKSIPAKNLADKKTVGRTYPKDRLAGISTRHTIGGKKFAALCEMAYLAPRVSPY